MDFWNSEACDLMPDPVSGARICRLTYAAAHSTNLYYEQPYSTPDGKRIAFGRATHVDPRFPPTELWAADLETLRVHCLERDIVSTWFATSPWSGKLFYRRSGGELVCADLATLEKKVVLPGLTAKKFATMWSVTPDMRYLVGAACTPDFHTEVTRVDLQTGEEVMVCRQPRVLGHIQINPATGRDVLVQVNRGMAMDNHRQVRPSPDSIQGATHLVLDLFDGSTRDLKVGEPDTGDSTGHASWADAARMITPVSWPGMRVDFHNDAERPLHDQRHPQGNLVRVGPDDEAPEIFPAPSHLFDHASASRCGHYFVADCVCHGVPGAVEVVIGNWDSGKCRVLIQNTGAQMGGPACSHVHPYLTADNRHVIYNADPYGLCQVHKAEIPAGFLELLT